MLDSKESLTGLYHANEDRWIGVGVRLLEAKKPLKQEVIKIGISHWYYVFSRSMLYNFIPLKFILKG